MPLDPGTRFGPYEIVAPIGAGGMGEVYKARDTRLNRTVAVKILPSHIAAREDLRARFEREARAVSSLNHPNICTLHDVGNQDGIDFLVMEHLEGETLAGRLERGPLPPGEVVKYAMQIASAVDRAHRSGIVHRDLKPGNIILTRDGAKVLDFGLARTAPAAAVGGATLTQPLTTEGTVLGTPQYMSPEQIEGRETDARTDIFAFGCVVYEMVTGRRAFDGQTRGSVIGAVLGAEPPAMSALQPVTPRALENIVAGCLVKDADQRYQSLWDVLIDLRTIAGTGAEGARGEAKRSWLPWAAAAILGVAALAASAAWYLKAPPAGATVRFQVDPPENFSGHFQLSPDGRYLAMVAQRKLWIRELGSLEAKALDGAEDPSYPFWSPDSASVGFWAQNRLRRVAVTGGRVQIICDPGRMRGASWSKDGTIVFSGHTGIQRVPADGGTPVEVTRVPGGGNDAHRYPAFLPDGRHFLFLHQSGDAAVAGIYVGSLDGGAPVRLLPDDSNALYAPAPRTRAGGYLFVRRENTLMAQPFDADALRVVGEPFPVAEGVGLGPNRNLGAFSVSAGGELAYRSGVRDLEEVAWFDRAGKRLGTVTSPGQISTFTLSPDQRQLAVSRVAVENSSSQDDIWLQGATNGVPSRFTYGPRPGWSYPLWAPDGRSLVYGTANVVGVPGYEIRWKPANMVGKDESLLRSATLVVPWDWSPDGKWLVYDASGRLMLIPLGGDRKPVAFAPASDRFQRFAQFSPDSRWIAYAGLDESGRSEVYVQPVPTTGAKWQLSLTGGTGPRWRKDGKEVFFVSADNTLMAVPVNTGKPGSAAAGSFEHGAPQPLFPVNARELYYQYQPAADGQRFLVLLPASGEKPSPITLVLNWESELKR